MLKICVDGFARKMRKEITKVDDKRDCKIKKPEGVISYLDIYYTDKKNKFYSLDIYLPSGEIKKRTTAVVVHGGGFIYGTKERYSLYAMELARLGLNVICYSYPYGDKKHFPEQLNCLDKVLSFEKENASKYGFDINNTFLVGDSAGANMSLQYGIINSNEEYNKLFNMKNDIKIKGLVLNCGVYEDLGSDRSQKISIYHAYLGHNYKDDPRYVILNNITKDLPEVFAMSCEKDFLIDHLPMLTKKLDEVGVNYESTLCKSKEGDKLFHVFHLNIIDEYAQKLNEEEVKWMINKSK